MRLRTLAIYNFRSLQAAELSLHDDTNLIIGGNAAGKTSLLESIGVLGRGRSHRSPSIKLAKRGESSWKVSGTLIAEQNDRPADQLIVTWREAETKIDWNGKPASVGDLVRRLPSLLLDPGSHGVMEDGPGERRRLLDWGVFHVEHRYQQQWNRFARVLKQRNSALRSAATTAALEPWTRELLRASEEITRERNRYVDDLRPIVERKASKLLPGQKLKIEFRPGWATEREYADVLRSAMDGDRELGHTRYGPHRADLLVLSDNRATRDYISRGEQKLMIASLLLAQLELYEQVNQRSPLFLIDDFSSELSQQSQLRFAEELRQYRGQKFISALTAEEPLITIGEHAMFHVEHGTVTRKY